MKKGGEILWDGITGIAFLLFYWGYQTGKNGGATDLSASLFVSMPFIALVSSIISIIKNKINLINILFLVVSVLLAGYVLFLFVLGSVAD